MSDAVISEVINWGKNKKEAMEIKKKFKESIKNLSDEEKSVLREFIMQSKTCKEKDYAKFPEENDTVIILVDKDFLIKVKNQEKPKSFMLYKKSKIAQSLLNNTDIGFPQNEITEEIKKEFKEKRPAWVYPPPPIKYEIRKIGNIYGK
jgi:hypothetical protein